MNKKRYFQPLFAKFICLFTGFFLICCAETTEHSSSSSVDSKIQRIDTLEFHKVMPTQEYSPNGFSIKIFDSTLRNAYPFEKWVEWRISWAEKHNQLVKNCSLLVDCPYPNVHFKKKNDSVFYIKIDSQYQGKTSFRNEEERNKNLLLLELALSPNEGFVIDSYFRTIPIESNDTLMFTQITNRINWEKQ
jgi:hypothetical protein